MIYTKTRFIAASTMDCTAKVGVANAVVLIQDNLTECFGMLHADNYEYKSKYNAFWAFTKNRVHFERCPDWREEYTATTFPSNNTGFRTNVNSIFKDKEGNTLFTSNIECCCLNFDTHRPVKLSETSFPKENFPAPVFSEPFTKIEAEVSEEDFVYEQKVMSQHMDMSRHLNNTEYVKLAMNTFSADYLASHNPKDLEVHYLGESTENQLLRIYKKEMDGSFIIKIKEAERFVFEMRLEFY